MVVDEGIRDFNKNFSQVIDVMLGDCVYKNWQGGDNYDVFFVDVENGLDLAASLTFDDESGLFPRYHNLFEVMEKESVLVKSIKQSSHDAIFHVVLKKGNMKTPKIVGEELDICLIYALNWLAVEAVPNDDSE